MASGADQFVDLLMALREENHGRKPSANQLAKALGISAHDAKEILDDMDPAPQNKKLRVSKEPDHHPPEPPAAAPSCPPDLEDTFRDEDVKWSRRLSRFPSPHAGRKFRLLSLTPLWRCRLLGT